MESQVPNTVKEEPDDGSPQHRGVVDIKLEPVDNHLKDLDCSEYIMKIDADETEAFVKTHCAPNTSEQDYEQVSKETIKEEISFTMQITEDMESGGCAVKAEGDDDEPLMKPLFVAVKAEPYSEETSEESVMEENLKAFENEDKQLSAALLTRYSEEDYPLSKTHKAVCDAGLDQHAAHNNSEETSSADEELSMQCLNHRGKSQEENFKNSGAPFSSYVEKGVRGEYRKQDCNLLEMCRGKSCHEKRCKQEMQSSCSKGSSSKQTGEQKKIKKPFCCNICFKCFYSTRDLANHERIHSGEKPFECAACGKTWTTKSSLVEHMTVHSEERPYKCSLCEKSFKGHSHLKKHMLIHTGEKPFKCNMCGKAFAQSNNLNIHIRTHTGKKPYTCTECEKAFSDHSALIRHKRVHSGEKLYKCNECGKAFLHSYHLTIHKRVHSGERPFVCSDCGSAFTTSSNLSRHRASVH